MSDDKRLMDCKQVMEQYDVTRGVAENLMRACQRVPHTGRRWLVRHAELETKMKERAA